MNSFGPDSDLLLDHRNSAALSVCLRSLITSEDAKKLPQVYFSDKVKECNTGWWENQGRRFFFLLVKAFLLEQFLLTYYYTVLRNRFMASLNKLWIGLTHDLYFEHVCAH